MRHFFVCLTVFFIIFYSCQKEKVKVEYDIEITGTSKDTVRADDILGIYIDWKNSEPTDQVNVSIGDIGCQVLGLKDDSILSVKIPAGWGYSSGNIHLKHPNGAEAWWGIKKEGFPLVASVSAMSGIGGDIITITGKDFSFLFSLQVSINTLECEIKELNDTVMKVVVPTGCGNGPFRIYFGNKSDNCYSKTWVDLGLFSYNFQSISERKVTKYSSYSKYYEIERDVLGRITKRVRFDSDGVPKGLYDTLFYGADGLLEKIIEFWDDGSINKYKIYEQNNDVSLIEVTIFDRDDEFVEKFEYNFLNRRLVQLNRYKTDNWLYLTITYEYQGDHATITETSYTNTGTVSTVYVSDTEYDTQNGFLPKVGIPGHEDEMDQYPYRYYGVYNCKNYYNEYGELIKADRYWHCEFDIIRNSYEYD
jgi:hypothetical protein